MRFPSPIPLPPPLSPNGEFKQTTTVTSARNPSNKRFDEQNNICEDAVEFLVHFLALLCTTTTN